MVFMKLDVSDCRITLTFAQIMQTYMKMFSFRPLYLYSAAISVFFLFCFVCCPKDVTEEAVLNLHFTNVQASDTIIVGFPDYTGKPDSALFLYEPGQPVNIRFVDHGTNSLNAGVDYLWIHVPSHGLTDTLQNMNITREQVGGCREPDKHMLYLEKDGNPVGPEGTIDLYY